LVGSRGFVLVWSTLGPRSEGARRRSRGTQADTARIQKLHIKEFSRKKRDNQGLWKGFDVPLLEGDNDWPAVMKAVDDIGYHGWAITEQGGGDSPEGLRDLCQRLEKILAS
jgi:hexulose-6-phosphate isomerase